MKRIVLISILFCAVFAFVSPFPSTAQTPAGPKCDPGAVIKAANELKATGDNQKDLESLLKLRDDISAANVACTGLTFSGKDASKVVGPFVLPVGVYKVTATTKGFLILHIKLTTPSCDPFLDDEGIANVGKGEGDTGAEQILTVEHECKMYLQPSNVSAPWTVTFEPLQ